MDKLQIPELQQAGAWLEVFDLCLELGMDTESGNLSGKQNVLRFIKELYNNSEEYKKICDYEGWSI